MKLPGFLYREFNNLLFIYVTGNLSVSFICVDNILLNIVYPFVLPVP